MLKPLQKFSRLQLTSFASVFAVAGITIILFTYAAGAASFFVPQNGTLTAGATIVNNSGASGGKAVRFGSVATPTPTPSPTPSSMPSPTPTPTPPPAGGFPSAANTGPVGCSSYTQYTGTLSVTTDGTVLNCIQLKGTLEVNASNVTVQNSILTGTSWWGVRFGNTNAGVTNLKLLHNKLQTVLGQGPDNGGYDYGVAPNGSGYMEIAFNDISGYKDGADVSVGYVHDNYIHTLSRFTGSHSQCIYVYTGPGRVNIEHNTLINDAPQDQASAAIYIAPDDGHQNDRLTTNNLMAGGSLTFYGGDSTATNIVVTSNQFSTQLYPNGGFNGAVGYWWPNNAGNVWSGNTWADGPNAGKPVVP